MVRERDGGEDERIEHVHSSENHGHQPRQPSRSSDSYEDWLMSDAQRRAVTVQDRRCINSSWEECEEAMKLETRMLSKTERQKLKRHISAACPEIKLLDVI